MKKTYFAPEAEEIKLHLEQCIAQSRAVSALAGNIINNATTAISLMRFKSMDCGLGNALVDAPKMLGGGE